MESVFGRDTMNISLKIRISTKRATKLIISIKHLKYEERLRYLKLPTLKF